MEDQWKKDFEKFMESLYNGVSLEELMGEYMKSLLAVIPYIGNYFSTALSSYDHSVQMKALYRIFQLSKEYKDEIIKMKDDIDRMKEIHKEEIEKMEEVIHILEREGRQYEREKFPFQIFHSHQFDEVKTILRFSPEDIRSHIERDVEKVEFKDSVILVGKIGAGKTTSLLKLVEKSNPDLIIVIKDNIKAIETKILYEIESVNIRTNGIEKINNLKHVGECVVIWDDIQYSPNEFLRALPVLRELKNVKFIGSVRSADYVELENDRYFREAQFEKVDVEELNEKEVKELAVKCWS